MATSGTVIERFAQASGYLPSTLGRMLRALRAAGLAPFGEQGRGQRVGHYEAAHLANVVAAFGGGQPADAARAAQPVRTLPLPHRGGTFSSAKEQWPSYEPGDLHSPKANVGQALEHMISEAANLIDRHHHGWLSDTEYKYQINQLIPYEIRVGLVPLVVQMHWFGLDDDRNGPATRIDHYYQSATPSGGVTNVTFIHREVIVAAAELLRENPSWQPNSPLPSTDPAAPNAGQKDENAGPSPEDPASTLGSDHPRAHGSGRLRNQPEDICEKKDFQGYARAEAVTPP